MESGREVMYFVNMFVLFLGYIHVFGEIYQSSLSVKLASG